MTQPVGRYDSSGVSGILRANDRRATPPIRPMSQDIPLKISDLEEKHREQERFNSYLIDQINKLEANLNKLYTRGPSASRGDERVFRIEEDLKKLEMQLGKENRDLKAYQQDSELVQMRNFIQEKITEDYKIHQKHKEKSQVLFGEIVRLGENYEKTNEFLQNLSLSLENRMLILENRINNGERQVATIDNGTGNMNMLIDLAEKLDKRFQMVETALLALGGEHEKNARTIDKVENGAYHLQEDLNIFFKQLQTDIHKRIELKSSDLLNKLLQEQEERLRNHEDIKYTFDLKDKMTQEKLQFDRNEFKARLSTLESFSKAEFQRKDEMIQALNSNLDNQVRNIVENIRMNENLRQEREDVLTAEMANTIETNRQAIDQYKSFQSSITEKVTEMVKTEIDVRQKGEKDLKNLIQATMKGILQEISMQKDIIDRLKLKFDHDIHETQNSFSEKADILSRYIEEETQRSNELIKSQHSQTKEMITKITESLKTTIISNEKWKSEVIKRFGKIDQHLQAFKQEVSTSVETNETRLFLKLRELQSNLEDHLATNTKVLESRMETLSGALESSLSSFESSLLHNREVFVDIINKLNADISDQHIVVCKDLQNLANEIYNFQGEIDSVTEVMNDKVQELVKKIALAESEAIVMINSEKFFRESLINRVSEDFDERIKEFEEKIEVIDERLTEEEKIQQGNDDRNIENFAEITKKLKKISEVTKGSKTGKLLEAEEKERNELINEAQYVVENLLQKVEIMISNQKINDIVINLNNSETEIQKLKEILNKKVDKLKNADKKTLEEVKIMVEEMFDKKVTNIQEKISRDHEKLWNTTVNKVKEPDLNHRDELAMLNDKISEIATTERENFRPKLRY
jgi:hypothetical protein